MCGLCFPLYHASVLYRTGRYLGIAVLRYRASDDDLLSGDAISMQQLTLEVFLASLSCGLIIDTLLIVNNYRDINNDKKSGKRTLVVLLGASASRMLYLGIGFVAVLIGIVFSFNGSIWGHRLAFASIWFFTRWLTVRWWKSMRERH